MTQRNRIMPPVFELGLKAYVYGQAAVALAIAADRLSQKHGVTVILAPQSVDLAAVAGATQHLLVFAQHVDPIPIGRGHGTVLAEAVEAAGGVGVQLNHMERRVSFSDLAEGIARAHAVGLAALVYADSPRQAAALAHLEPDLILAEPPELIGTEQSVAAANQAFIAQSVEAVRAVDEEILVLNSAGIRTGADAAAVIQAGADGTGATSGVVKAPDPVAALDAMLQAVRQAWDERP